MPPEEEPPLSEKQIEIIRRWIDAGAPAENPELVYGAGFFQFWGTTLLVICGLNLLIITIASHTQHSYGYHVLFVSMAPLFLIGISNIYWYPPDQLSVIACLVIPIGFAIGGGMLSKKKGYGCRLGICLGLFLSTIGLIVLATLKTKRLNPDLSQQIE